MLATVGAPEITRQDYEGGQPWRELNAFGVFADTRRVMSATAALAPRPTRVIPWSRLGDEALAGRAAGGNDAAFSELYERYYGPLLGYTRSILRDAEDARDATQNALENAFRALPCRDKSLPLRPWLYKIAHNEAITIMRRRRPQTELAPELEPMVPGPEAAAEQRGRLAQLVDDLQSLPERQRGALVMRELNGLSYDEIATALGLTNEAARRAVFDARTALHAAVDGRATECVSVRHCISDGDRRSLRARSIRAHLRSCDDCASFQRSIGARRADLHVLAPWMSGAAVMGALGVGAGSAGGGAVLTAGGGASAAAGGGGGIWASLPLAAKGLAVAAAVATTGTAAVGLKHVAQPQHPATHAQTAPPRTSRADAVALRAAALAAGAAARAATTAPARGNRVRTGTQGTTSSAGSTATTKRHHDAPALLPPAPSVQADPAPAAATPQTAPAASPSSTTPATAPTAPESAVAKLGRLGERVQQVLADATAIAADGTQEALALASGLLDRTLGPLRTSIDRLLASLGLSLPAPAAAPAPAAPTSTASVLAPVQHMLGGVQSLLEQLLGQR
jgi:RNA polymerase sigma factor (sigma-70 family)